ncbi:putative carboxylesterase [Aspergillus clavatus NRRL 1]|uniref:Carboxylic ester hydrolase n=1 Tax=Aspergillus clavatus (strain ATCC 1007 / CBS 513.65 / DSM 816 / NCTC 3887 / NRRL 1 / QM 1276 / 107) TaxID=344612 RepID=A1C8A2_ASPCL|nr:carboxylesterase family protein [Aspergillus clavatus NRRL 1]EAW14623.1 carboxylesterase family protein [Aspergillus clavatus NRRL 1]
MRFSSQALVAIGLAPIVGGSPAPSSGLTVNLGYSSYQGYFDSANGLNIWKGIRYAAPPVGHLRWQPPNPPVKNNSRVLPAVDQPPYCPQSGAAGTPTVYGFNSAPGNEDCLFLNVYAPPGASDLPVFVWIHGGGYGLFGAVYDPSPLMNTNNNGFITVEIQYRLGAFGFLSSPEVHRQGALNAGLLDQRFAMKWVQQNIAQFGGDPSRVTIAGESAGAGSVMLHSLAYAGRDANLFQNIIAASPYSPPVYNYDDAVPTGYYQQFADLAGCGASSAANPGNSTFACLVAAPTEVLQNASGIVSTSAYFGTFAFQPVVDGDMIQQLPSAQLAAGNVSGHRILVGNNANDGVPLSNPNILGRDAFNDHLTTTFPDLTAQDLARLNQLYGTADSNPADDGPRFDTLGTSGPTAKNQSEMATGLQQTVFNIFAETTFDCAAQWLAEAFSGPGRQAWKYQYSVTPAFHGADLNSYFNMSATWPSAGFNHAFQKLWGNFIMNNRPIIPLADATANNNLSVVPVGPPGYLNWPQYRLNATWQLDLNTTGGFVTPVVVTPNLTYYVRQGNDVVNNFRLVDAHTWEGGRGMRCSFWRSVASRVPF